MLKYIIIIYNLVSANCTHLLWTWSRTTRPQNIN